MTSFTAQKAMALPGSSALQKVRSDFAHELQDTPRPTSRDELWRYSKIDSLNWDKFSPLDAEDVQNLRKENLPGGGPAARDIGERSCLVIFHNGVIVHVDLSQELVDKGVKVYDALCPGAFYEDEANSLRIEYDIDPGYSHIELLRNAFSISKCVIEIPDDVVIGDPIVIVHWVDKRRKAVFPIVEIKAGTSSEVTVVERFESADDIDILTAPATYIKAGDNSSIKYVQAQQFGNKTWNMNRLEAFGGRDSLTNISCIGMGGHYSRTRVITNLMGENSSSNINNVYAGSGNQVLDFRTNQNHYGNSSTSNLEFKGAVSNSAGSVYSGLIYIDEKASGCNADQSNKALVLTSGATAHSVPNLEINNDDVSCSHESAVGEVDAEQMYYLALRGFDSLEAKQLIVAGFFEDILSRFPIPGLAESLRKEVFQKVTA